MRVQRVHIERESERVNVCPNRTPEVHELGEFPMSCYLCHMYADA